LYIRTELLFSYCCLKQFSSTVKIGLKTANYPNYEMYFDYLVMTTK